MLTPLRSLLASLPLLGVLSPGCDPPRPPVKGELPPAYTSNQITDPALQKIVEQNRSWASKQLGDGGKPLYSRIEILSPVPIVQPYGVGVFQHEVRITVIYTTGPGWTGLKPEAKEAAVALAYREISSHLQSLKHEPALQPTLTVQTPQGMELAWINRLDPGRKNVHGDD
jgi:hypothetical protein